MSNRSNLERDFGLVEEEDFAAVDAGHDVRAAVGSPDKTVEMGEGVAAVESSCSRT